MAEVKAEEKWKALESNPDVLNEFASKLGLSDNFEFVDIFSLDEEMESMFPGLVSVIFLFPSKAKSVNILSNYNGENIFYITQIPELGNACGTIAVLHSLANNYQLLGINDDSIFGKFYRSLEKSSPLDRGNSLNSSEEINNTHNSFALQGDSQVQIEGVDHHFVAFTIINGSLFELDGCKNGPINHGEIKEGSSLFSAATSKIKEIYLNDPDLIDFALIGLSHKQD